MNQRERQRQLLEYLTQVTVLTGVRSLTGLVQKHGQLYQPAKLPKGVLSGTPKECFKNAFLLAMVRDDLTYVEGFACHMIPTLHAWCVTKAGAVIDPTWDDPQVCAYYGIAFDWKYARKTVFKKKVYGLLADWKTAAWLFDADPALWKLVPGNKDKSGE